MGDPPRDEDGIVTPHDDRTAIPDDALVVRYIHEQWLIPTPDGSRRLSKGAFSGSSKDKDQYEGMSVNMLSELKKHEVDPATRMPENHEGAVTLRAGDLRELGLEVGPDPGLRNDPYHAAVWGVKSSHRKKIKNLCKWLIKPQDVAPLD